MAETPLEPGCRVQKIKSELGDTHKDGALARVQSALGPAEDGEFGYFVYWDDLPGLPMFIRGKRLRPIIDVPRKTN